MYFYTCLITEINFCMYLSMRVMNYIYECTLSYNVSLEKGWSAVCDTTYTIYLSLSQKADPNPFQGTHCIHCMLIQIVIYWQIINIYCILLNKIWLLFQILCKDVCCTAAAAGLDWHQGHMNVKITPPAKKEKANYFFSIEKKK